MKTATLPLETAGPVPLDEKRHAFLVKLAQSNLPLTHDESHFVLSMCGRLHFSTGEQAEVDRLVHMYGATLLGRAPLPRRPITRRPTPHSALRTPRSRTLHSALRTPHFT